MNRWGIQIGKFSVCWYDLWAKTFCFEVAWGQRRIIDL